MVDSTPCQLWLVNRSNVSRDVGACELFGFNVGVFTDKPQGTVRAVLVCNFDGSRNIILHCARHCKDPPRQFDSVRRQVGHLAACPGTFWEDVDLSRGDCV